jgi:hypothetical protein
MKIGVTQPGGDAVEGWRGQDAAKRAWSNEAHVIQQDQEHVGRALWRPQCSIGGNFELRSLASNVTSPVNG